MITRGGGRRPDHASKGSILIPRSLRRNTRAPDQQDRKGPPACGECEVLAPSALVPTRGRTRCGIDFGQISSYSALVRRKSGALIPIETSILEAGLRFRDRGQYEFHGYLVAKELRDSEAARRLTAHGTLYKALDRMERAGLLESRWEDPSVAAGEGRPRRRLYRVSGLGERALVPPATDPRTLALGLG